jgi:pilus assembly protein Flp/PilA
MRIKALLAKFKDDENGATAIEYGLIAALISVGIIGAVTLLGDNLETTFRSITTTLSANNTVTTTPPASS